MQLNFEEENFRSRCSVTCALEIIGDKWTLLIVRDAIYRGYTTFGQFRDSTEKIASNILTSRLEKLVSKKILTKTRSEQNLLVFDYKLTEMGKSLKPVLEAIENWSISNINGVNKLEDIPKFDKLKTKHNKT